MRPNIARVDVDAAEPASADARPRRARSEFRAASRSDRP